MIVHGRQIFSDPVTYVSPTYIYVAHIRMNSFQTRILKQLAIQVALTLNLSKVWFTPYIKCRMQQRQRIMVIKFPIKSNFMIATCDAQLIILGDFLSCKLKSIYLGTTASICQFYALSIQQVTMHMQLMTIFTV